VQRTWQQGVKAAHLDQAPTTLPSLGLTLLGSGLRTLAPAAWRPDCSTKAAMRPTAVRVAEAIARPLPVAAVVLPSASSLSVRERM
jgi:hypothetical protein